MNKIRTLLDRTIEALGCSALLTMVAVACWQVISRYVFNSPSTFSEEFLRFSLIWVSLIGLAYVAGKQEHISFTLFLDKCPPHLVHIWKIVLQLVFILFAIYVLIIGGWNVSSMTINQISPVLQVSMGKVYYALPVSGVIVIIYSILNIADLVKSHQPKVSSGVAKASLEGHK
ncbi:TRAP transporter small permease [Vibrio aestuarianus]|uniref:TRAP transporter small permease protein n=1 Tax=Vibrio aestuarianus TaxID=28171 RepID=A0ABD7YNW3_9VIBR|nr:TRAP transporter small permease [Vibrio aestuarianus]WGK86143.1 TRAP transporter small permease [Vibrio aestuarianus]CAH8194712.1 putative membrane transport protein [Vibrio aestuarianus]